MSFMRGRTGTLIASVAALTLAGCGSTTIHHVTRTVTRPQSTSTSTPTTTARTATATTTARTATTAAAAPVSPRTLLRRASAALRHAGGYRMHAEFSQAGQRSTLNLIVDTQTRYRLYQDAGAVRWSMVALPDATYLYGDRAYWRRELRLARTHYSPNLFLGSWLHLHRDFGRAVTRQLRSLAPITLGRCLDEDLGRLTIAGHTTIDGTRVIVIRDAGNVPGSAPSTVDVAASGPPYPVRYDATGATRRGGHIDVCNDGKGDDATGTIQLSRFGTTPIERSPNASRSVPPGVTL